MSAWANPPTIAGMAPATETTPTTETPPTRRPYKGSCHCGRTRYVVYLTLPLESTVSPGPGQQPPLARQLVYKCNCTTCQKAGILHIRLVSAPDDFMLLAPLDPLRDLADYRCFAKRLHWLFCRECGVRCFTFKGEGEVVEVEDLPGREGEKVTVWRPKKEGWVERGGPVETRGYLSVNGYTLDAGQESLDLREWTEGKKVLYLDCLPEGDDGEVRRYERPHVGGAY